MKEIYKCKQIWINGEPQMENIGDYIRTYFNNNNYIIVPNTDKGFYNFLIGSKKYDSEISRINKEYKLVSEEGYWHFFKVKELKNSDD